MNRLDSCAALLLDLLAINQRRTNRLIIGITSARRGEGRTRLACELAETLTKEMERPTLLVDLDFDQPDGPKHQSMGHQLGLEEAVLHEAVLQQISPNLWVLVVGDSTSRSLKLSAALLEEGLPLSKIQKAMGSEFVTVLDLPPLLESPLGLQLADLATHLVLAVRANVTSGETVKQALARLDEANYRSKLTHTVLVGSRRRTPKWLLKLGF